MEPKELQGIITTEFEKFQKSNPDKKFTLSGDGAVCGPDSSTSYYIMEFDKQADKPLHLIARISFEDILGPPDELHIGYEHKWYPGFSEYAKNIGDAFKKVNGGKVNIFTKT